jgi:hypothetical protein
MNHINRYRQYAAECVRQAQAESTVDDQTILLNVALAWLRLAQQTETFGELPDQPPAARDDDDGSGGAAEPAVALQ